MPKRAQHCNDSFTCLFSGVAGPVSLSALVLRNAGIHMRSALNICKNKQGECMTRWKERHADTSHAAH